MSACIVKPHRAGLFSNINKVITCLRMYDHVHVDWSEGSLYGDCWSDLFEPTSFPEEPADIITDYPFYDLTAACAGILYQNESWGWRNTLHPLWEKLGVRKDLIDRALKMTLTVPLEATGVIIRNDGHAGEQLSGRSQTLNEYAKAIEAVGNRHIFTMSGDLESLKWLNERFLVWHPADTKRTKTRSDPDRHLAEPQTPEDAKQVMIELLAIANCRTLIHPISNMATAALYINPNLKSIYLK